MDILNPDTYWIDNRCYRKNPSRRGNICPMNKDTVWSSRDGHREGAQGCDIGHQGSSSATATPQSSANLRPYVEEDDYACDPDAPDEIEDEQNYVVEPTENGFKTKCDNISPQFYAVIIGAKGQTKSRIERETCTKIIVPKQGEKGAIIIRGQKRADVINSRRRIELLTSQARSKRDPTHFPCFPLNHPSIIKKMREFKEAVLEECANSVRGIDEDLFVDFETIHLTICVTTLLDEKERNTAADILKSLQKEITETIGHKGKLPVQIKGLEIMNDDPTRVDVLYAKCNSEGNKLQKIADLVATKFIESGFAKPNRGESVKVHCTLLNSRKKAERLGQREPGSEENWGNGPNEGNRRPPGFNRETFDASLILSKFKDYDFGRIDITEIKLATRHSYGSDGFYKAFCTIQL